MRLQALASRPTTEKYRRMLAAYEACKAAGAAAPVKQEF